jgi:hypothetical protein
MKIIIRTLKNAFLCMLVVGFGLFVPLEAFSQIVTPTDRPIEDPREVYEELDRRERSVVYETATLEMRIIDQRGRERVRELQSWSYSRGDVSKSLIRFNSPADVRGTGFLSVSEGSGEVQRLFLPALNRIQTIQASQRGDRFMGSDFTYEDLGERNADDFEFHVLENDTEIGVMMIKATPAAPASYSYAHFEIDTRRYVLLKATYFDDKNAATRELIAENVSEISSDLWRADKLTMRDVKSGRRTELVWKSRSFDEKIDDVVFTERNLMRF